MVTKVFYLTNDEIKRDEGRFQLRAGTSMEAIERLADSMRHQGFQELHPLSLWKEGETWWLIDGFHRMSAARLAGIEKFPCVEFIGTEEEAFAHGIAQNRDHGRQLDMKTDYRHAAKKMRASGMSLSAIANVLWPLPREKWRNGSQHPKYGTVQSWVDPNRAARRNRNSSQKDRAHGVANRLIKEDKGEDFTPTTLEPDEYAASLETAVANKVSKAERAAERAAEMESRAYAIKEQILASIGSVPDWVLAIDETNGNRGVPCSIWSDWHYGEVVRMNGAEVFNQKIADQRIRLLTERIISLCFNHMGKATIDYPGFVLMLGGDMIGGDIHEELAATNDLTASESIIELKRVLIWAITQIADAFGRVFIPCVVGNHGRTTKKPQFKYRTETSFETVLYVSLMDHFKAIGDSRVHFFIPRDFDARFKVAGTRYLLTHGDAIGTGGGDGIIGAIGPISRGTFKVRNAEINAGDGVDMVVMGHWHQTLWLPHVIVNNSLKGNDEYAKGKLRAAPARASQCLWFTHPKHGITARWEVFLEAREKKEDAEHWVTWDGRGERS